MKTILKNNWHLHFLAFALSIYFLNFTTKNPGFMVIGESGKFLQGFTSIFLSAFLAYSIEWVQGKFFGANKTLKEVQASDFDMLVGISAATLGLVVYFAFYNIQIAHYSILVVLILDIYKRINAKL